MYVKPKLFDGCFRYVFREWLHFHNSHLRELLEEQVSPRENFPTLLVLGTTQHFLNVP